LIIVDDLRGIGQVGVGTAGLPERRVQAGVELVVED
jgi:hypothetical protein